jgi:hypothetical protein
VNDALSAVDLGGRADLFEKVVAGEVTSQESAKEIKAKETKSSAAILEAVAQSEKNADSADEEGVNAAATATTAGADAAGVADRPTHDSWLPPEQIVKLLLHCSSTGKAPDGFRLYPVGAAIGQPDAGTVIFQQVSENSKIWRCHDEHAWNSSDGAVEGSQLKVQGEQLLRARQIEHRKDRSFRRRVYCLLQGTNVRMVHYIHTDGARQPISSSGGLKRSVEATTSVSSVRTVSERDMDMCSATKRIRTNDVGAGAGLGLDTGKRKRETESTKGPDDEVNSGNLDDNDQQQATQPVQQPPKYTQSENHLHPSMWGGTPPSAGTPPPACTPPPPVEQLVLVLVPSWIPQAMQELVAGTFKRDSERTWRWAAALLIESTVVFEARPMLMRGRVGVFREAGCSSRQGTTGTRDRWMNSGGKNGSSTWQALPFPSARRIRCHYGEVLRTKDDDDDDDDDDNGLALCRYHMYTIVNDPLDRRLFVALAPAVPDVVTSTEVLGDEGDQATAFQSSSDPLNFQAHEQITTVVDDESPAAKEPADNDNEILRDHEGRQLPSIMREQPEDDMTADAQLSLWCHCRAKPIGDLSVEKVAALVVAHPGMVRCDFVRFYGGTDQSEYALHPYGVIQTQWELFRALRESTRKQQQQQQQPQPQQQQQPQPQQQPPQQQQQQQQQQQKLQQTTVAPTGASGAEASEAAAVEPEITVVDSSKYTESGHSSL